MIAEHRIYGDWSNQEQWLELKRIAPEQRKYSILNWNIQYKFFDWKKH